MNPVWRLAAHVVFVLTATAVPLGAQPASSPLEPSPSAGPRQVVSANPFGLLFEFFNAEYERKVSDSVSAGTGGSFFKDEGEAYVNADVFVRYYPSGRPLDGWAFGVKAGATNVEAATYFGVGVDVNWSWLMGKHDNFYLGVGFGLKRLFGTGDTGVVPLVPTIRVINIGVAF